jgi:hypothetical protein
MTAVNYGGIVEIRALSRQRQPRTKEKYPMRRWMATGLLTAMLATLPGVALAGSGGRKNTAIALTGGALYTWINGGTKSAGRRNTAIALTAASVSAWHKYKKAKRAERKRAQQVNAHYARYYTPASSTRSYRRSSNGRASGSASGTYSQGYRAGYRQGYRVGYQAGYRDGVRAVSR